MTRYTNEQRIEMLIRGIIKPGGFAMWWDMEMTKLGGKTPRELLDTDFLMVLDLALGYFDTSYT